MRRTTTLLHDTSNRPLALATILSAAALARLSFSHLGRSHGRPLLSNRLSFFSPFSTLMATSFSSTADVIVHLDLNKTILAVDEVKLYGAEEVVYLEQWKGDDGFLRWAHEVAQGEAGAAAAAAFDAWRTEFTVSKNEPELIARAHEYCALDAGRQQIMAETLGKIGSDDCVESFWRALEWIKGPGQNKNVLVVFRTFGSDMPSMFDRCAQHGYGDAVVKDEGTGEPVAWTMLHALGGTREETEGGTQHEGRRGEKRKAAAAAADGGEAKAKADGEGDSAGSGVGGGVGGGDRSWELFSFLGAEDTVDGLIQVCVHEYTSTGTT